MGDDDFEFNGFRFQESENRTDLIMFLFENYPQFITEDFQMTVTEFGIAKGNGYSLEKSLRYFDTIPPKSEKILVKIYEAIQEYGTNIFRLKITDIFAKNKELVSAEFIEELVKTVDGIKLGPGMFIEFKEYVALNILVQLGVNDQRILDKLHSTRPNGFGSYKLDYALAIAGLFPGDDVIFRSIQTYVDRLIRFGNEERDFEHYLNLSRPCEKRVLEAIFNEQTRELYDYEIINFYDWGCSIQ